MLCSWGCLQIFFKYAGLDQFFFWMFLFWNYLHSNLPPCMFFFYDDLGFHYPFFFLVFLGNGLCLDHISGCLYQYKSCGWKICACLVFFVPLFHCYSYLLYICLLCLWSVRNGMIFLCPILKGWWNFWIFYSRFEEWRLLLQQSWSC